MNSIFAVIFNHGQQNFIENNILLNRLPYCERNILKIIVADDGGLSNKILREKFSYRKDFVFIDKDQEYFMPSRMQQIYSLYKCLEMIEINRHDKILLMDGDDFILKYHFQHFDHDVYKYFIGELTESQSNGKVFREKLFKRSWHGFWCRVVPTSGITISVGFLQDFESALKSNIFGDVWLDTRINFLAYWVARLYPGLIQTYPASGTFHRELHSANFSKVPFSKKMHQLHSSRRLWSSCARIVKDISK